MAQQYDTNYPVYETEPQRKRWPLAGVFFIDLVIILVVVLILTMMISFALIAWRSAQQGGVSGLIGADQSELLRLLGADGVFLTLLVQNLTFILVPIVRIRVLRHEPLSQIGFQAHQPLKLVMTGVGLGVVTLISNALLSTLFQSFGIEQNQAEQYPLFQGDYLGQILFLIGAALIVPIGEEVLFRGYAFHAFRLSWAKYAWGLPAAYILSALLFSIAHSLAATQGLLGLLVPAFVMGLLFALATQRTGSLLPSIIAHAMNNGLALSVLLLCVNNPGFQGCPSL